MLENYKEVVEALEDTNESVISHRLNNVLRVLTSISRRDPAADADRVSIWGMNVDVPGEGSIHAFWVIMGVMVGVLVGDARLLPPARLALDCDWRFVRCKPSTRRPGRV